MKLFDLNRKTLGLIAVVVPMVILFIYVGMTSGPLAPVAVTTVKVDKKAISPALFGIGTVEARYSYNIGPIAPGRLKAVYVDVGDRVKAGQLLAEMEPIDLDDKLTSQTMAIKRARDGIATAKAVLKDAESRLVFAQGQAERYQKLLAIKSVSDEVYEAKKQELQAATTGVAIAKANVNSAKKELARIQSDRKGLSNLRDNLRLVAPKDGVISARHSEAGSTVMSGQAVVEMIDPTSLWINTRFDQQRSTGLASDLNAQIKLRSQSQKIYTGKVERVEVMADAVTEEILAKIVFKDLPKPMPPIGELAEVTVGLSELPAQPVIPNAAIQQLDGQTGVWRVQDGDIQFVPVSLGVTSLDGEVQILDGLQVGDEIVVYSEHALQKGSKIDVVEAIQP
jgi:RND family efflux transporter MFP subunit